MEGLDEVCVMERGGRKGRAVCVCHCGGGGGGGGLLREMCRVCHLFLPGCMIQVVQWRG